MTSNPDSDDRAFVAALLGRDETTERAENRATATDTDAGNPVLDPDGARAIARRLFTPTTNEGQSA